jgi:hypothetical protein
VRSQGDGSAEISVEPNNSQLSAYSANHLDASVVVVFFSSRDLGRMKTCSMFMDGTTKMRNSAHRLLGKLRFIIGET